MTPIKQPRNVPRLDVLERFSLSPSGLHKVLKLGRFPQPFFVGAKPLWREADLAAVEAGTWKPEPRPAPEPEPEDDPLDLDEPASPKLTSLAPARPRGRPPKARGTPIVSGSIGGPSPRQSVPIDLASYAR